MFPASLMGMSIRSSECKTAANGRLAASNRAGPAGSFARASVRAVDRRLAPSH